MAVALVLARTETHSMDALKKGRGAVKVVPRDAVATTWQNRVAEKQTRHAQREREVGVLKAAVERIETCIAQQPPAEEGGDGMEEDAAPQIDKGKGKRAASQKGKGKAKAKKSKATFSGGEDDGATYFGSKLAALQKLLAERAAIPGGSGKAVVFSSDPDMLELAQRSLEAVGIASVCPKTQETGCNYDPSTGTDLVREERERIMLDFRTHDSAVKAMLLTLDPESSSGLTLTSADTIVLLNPVLVSCARVAGASRRRPRLPTPTGQRD